MSKQKLPNVPAKFPAPNFRRLGPNQLVREFDYLAGMYGPELICPGGMCIGMKPKNMRFAVYRYYPKKRKK